MTTKNIQDVVAERVEEIVEEYYMIFCHSVKTVPYHSTQTAVGEIDWLRTTLTQLVKEVEAKLRELKEV